MASVAHQLWPAPLRLQAASGGLFNRVLQVRSSTGTAYLKRFTDSAGSGNFPPLPTSASQRCLVASSWHDLASRAATLSPTVKVPPLLAVQTTLDMVAMAQAPGEPLYEALIGDGRHATATLQATAIWLGGLHTQPLEPRAQLLAASEAFKRFKIDLQYTRLLPDIPAPLRDDALTFTALYLTVDAEPVHGDLNSRNILCTEDGQVSVIDFEQGHFGEGLYDLAYLLGEYVIRDLRLGVNPLGHVSLAWESYRRARGWGDAQAEWRRLRTHLAFQTLYRLVGPSRQVWTGHLDAAAAQAVRQWSTQELAAWLR